MVFTKLICQENEDLADRNLKTNGWTVWSRFLSLPELYCWNQISIGIFLKSYGYLSYGQQKMPIRYEEKVKRIPEKEIIISYQSLLKGLPKIEINLLDYKNLVFYEFSVPGFFFLVSHSLDVWLLIHFLHVQNFFYFNSQLILPMTKRKWDPKTWNFISNVWSCLKTSFKPFIS